MDSVDEREKYKYSIGHLWLCFNNLKVGKLTGSVEHIIYGLCLSIDELLGAS